MQKKKIYQGLMGGVSMFCIASTAFLNFEPVIANGASDTDDITVTQVVSSEIAIDSPADVSMAGAIGGVSGGTGSGTAVWTVKTNNVAGFSLAIKASTSPALKSGSNTFADYVEAGAVPDYAWSVAAADSEFGYTVNAATVADMVAGFKDNGSNICGGAGTLNTTNTSCWDGLTTSDVNIISRSSATSAAGEAESITFQAQSGTSHLQPAGTYTATVTVTATTL